MNFKAIFSIVACVLFWANIASARPLDTADRARAVKNKLSAAVLELDGVNMIGVSGCHPKTGAKFLPKSDFVHCVYIGTETEHAFRYISKLYPRGTKIDGVFVLVAYVGAIEPQPRATAGN